MARPASPDAAAPDRPWKRPGAARYAAARLRGFLRSPADVYPPAPGSVMTENDVPITTRDGTVLRTNVYRTTGAGPFPVLLCAHVGGAGVAHHPHHVAIGIYRMPGLEASNDAAQSKPQSRNRTCAEVCKRHALPNHHIHHCKAS
jgi:predicted acyl esterase